MVFVILFGQMIEVVLCQMVYGFRCQTARPFVTLVISSLVPVLRQLLHKVEHQFGFLVYQIAVVVRQCLAHFSG